jgi:ferredoxin
MASVQDAAADRLPTSRLSCQIEVNDDMDGIVVEIAPVQ